MLVASVSNEASLLSEDGIRGQTLKHIIANGPLPPSIADEMALPTEGWLSSSGTPAPHHRNGGSFTPEYPNLNCRFTHQAVSRIIQFFWQRQFPIHGPGEKINLMKAFGTL